MAGALSRAAKERAESEAAVKLEAEAAEKAKLEASAKAEADKKAAEEEDEKKKKDEEAKKAAAAKKTESPNEADDEKMAAKARADQASIVEMCADAGVPKLAAALVKEGATLETAKKRIEAAGEIRGIVATARKINPAIDAKFADDLISAGASSEHARAQLFDKIISKQSGEIRSSHVAGNRSSGPANDDGWGKVISKINSKLGRKEA